MSADNDTAMLDTLTDEERAAIEEADKDELAALAAIAAGNTEGTGTDGEEDEDADDASAAPAAAPAAAAAPTAATPASPAAQATAEPPAAAPTPAPAPEPVASTAYRAELPADHAEKKAAAEGALADLTAKFKAGDLEVDEYETQRKAADATLRELERAELKAEIAREMTAQSTEAQWANAIRRQFDASKAAGLVDYDTDEAKRSDLDTFVRALGAKAENADKSMDWFLAEAHKRVLALHDIRPAAAAPAAKTAAPVPARTPPTAAVVPSLTNVPGGGAADDIGGDEFADIDRLDGLELEAALARMTPAQREKFERGA